MLHKTSLHKVIWMGFLIVFIAGQPASVSAEVSAWTGNGPEGGTIITLAIDPITPATLYAGTWTGIYKSTDGGGSWSPANTGLTETDITTLARSLTPTTLTRYPPAICSKHERRRE
jgi:hypothetical protein